MLITQDTKNRARNLESGGGLESGDGGDCVIGIEELEEQVSAKGGRTRCSRPHEAQNLGNIVKKSQQVHVIYPVRKFDFNKFQKSWKHPPWHHPLSIFVSFSFRFSETL